MNAAEQLWDWRRRIADLYGRIRANPDPQAAWQDWRDTRDRMFAQHPQSPLDLGSRTIFRGLALFDYDPALRFEVPIAPVEGRALVLPAGADGTVTARPFAVTSGLPIGQLTLYWIDGYGGGVFLPFTDATFGHETYGGGRYLLDTIKGADLGRAGDGRVVLDFNFAYAPSCAYSPAYVCPLAPAGNRLGVAVRGGERL